MKYQTYLLYELKKKTKKNNFKNSLKLFQWLRGHGSGFSVKRQEQTIKLLHFNKDDHRF